MKQPKEESALIYDASVEDKGVSVNEEESDSINEEETEEEVNPNLGLVFLADSDLELNVCLFGTSRIYVRYMKRKFDRRVRTIH